MRILFILLFLCTSCSSEVWTGPPCKKTAKVVSVDSIIYRGGWVTLDNGFQVNVGQPYTKITVGSEICIER